MPATRSDLPRVRLSPPFSPNGGEVKVHLRKAGGQTKTLSQWSDTWLLLVQDVEEPSVLFAFLQRERVNDGWSFDDPAIRWRARGVAGEPWHEYSPSSSARPHTAGARTTPQNPTQVETEVMHSTGDAADHSASDADSGVTAGSPPDAPLAGQGGADRRLPEHVEEKLAHVAGIAWAAPPVGARVGDYFLQTKLGEGAFAVVWKAHDSAGNVVALKIFSGTRFTDAERLNAARRFYLGAKSIQHLNAKSDSAHIVRVLNGPDVDGDYLWFAMQCFEDGDLDRALRMKHLSSRQRIQLIADVADAIGEAHKLSCVHRDLRPKNILLKGLETLRPQAVVADFDIAYHEPFVHQRDSTVGLQGVQRYTPTEVIGAVGDELKRLLREPSVDLYALCVVVFDMFAFKPSIPSVRTDTEIAKYLEGSEEYDPLPRRTRQGIAAFVARGIGHDPEASPHS